MEEKLQEEEDRKLLQETVPDPENEDEQWCVLISSCNYDFRSWKFCKLRFLQVLKKFDFLK